MSSNTPPTPPTTLVISSLFFELVFIAGYVFILVVTAMGLFIGLSFRPDSLEAAFIISSILALITVITIITTIGIASQSVLSNLLFLRLQLYNFLLILGSEIALYITYLAWTRKEDGEHVNILVVIMELTAVAAIPFLISTIAAWKVWLDNRVALSVIERRERSTSAAAGDGNEDVEANEETPLLQEPDEETGQNEVGPQSDSAAN